MATKSKVSIITEVMRTVGKVNPVFLLSAPMITHHYTLVDKHVQYAIIDLRKES